VVETAHSTPGAFPDTFDGRMAVSPDYDLVVIGAGPAGEKAAAQAAYFRKKVLVIEAEPEPGGAAVHTGTLPSKTLRETALYLSGHRARALYGVAVELDASATLQRLMSRKDAIAAAESQRFRANLARHGVEYVEGVGRFVDARTVEITSKTGRRRAREIHALSYRRSMRRRTSSRMKIK
jgi:NAD(P) transhydrogenase